ncbi:MAG: Tad domain-containing protein [Planctomycetota bacterium]|nr:Tad domain-containing protein [Planctomycetota bacterium]
MQGTPITRHLRGNRSSAFRTIPQERRAGTILVLAAALLVMVFAFVTFTVDVGYITLTKSKLQSATDSATFAAAQELSRGLGPNPELSPTSVESIARAAAIELASAHDAGGLASVYLNPQRDIRFGQITWDATADSWSETLDVGPFNFVQVTSRRDQGSVQNGDSDLHLFFGPVIGYGTAKLTAHSAAGMLVGNGFKIPSGSSQTSGVLPFAFDLPTWDAMLQGTGSDNYTFDPATGAITSGADGVLEVNIYPEAANNGNGNGGGNNGNSNSWTPGNRGTVDLGNPNNSTADLKRQILLGLNDSDLAYFGGELSFANGPIDVNGDPGISAGMKSELESIIGQSRAIPIFTQVTGNGNNTTYTIVKFVGVRILAVKLTGSNKYVIAQPAPYSDATVVPDTTGIPIQDATIFTPFKLLR